MSLGRLVRQFDRASGFSSTTFSHILTDREGNGWFSTSAGVDATLWCVRDDATRSWPLPPALAGNNVQSMTTDASGKLWLSVIRSGVHTFDDGVWRVGDGDAELAGPTAIVLASDRQGRIWLGYPRNRIALLDQGSLRHLGPEDGLDIGNTLSIVAGRDRVWLGGDRGLAWFDGRRVHPCENGAAPAFAGYPASWNAPTANYGCTTRAAWRASSRPPWNGRVQAALWRPSVSTTSTATAAWRPSCSRCRRWSRPTTAASGTPPRPASATSIRTQSRATGGRQRC
ncbi:hypothetical protein [Massilia sp. HP4]|uniref:hypothetical protein n=1 Tax=Massilia sp. HP4 TaxID=2562316 RepID=UPI001E48BAEB|nr:hypothetical protein [Massilia sp. HP4]